MKMNDKQVFFNELNAYKKSLGFKQFYEKIKDLNITDNAKFYYYKAWGAFKVESDYKAAEKYIEECESLFREEINLGEYFSQSDSASTFNNLPVMQKDSFRSFYQMAGEVYAINGRHDKALESYQKYQYYTEQVTNKVLDEKENVVLYSFRRFNEHTLADLINKQITVCHPSKMNDPFDSIANMWSSEDNLRRICKNPHCDKYIPIYSESFKYFRIRSFVANKNTYETDDNFLSKISMWSFYADEHRGFCIRYRLSKQFIKKPWDGSYCHLRIMPVKYVEEYDLSDKTYIDTNDSFGYKSMDWRNENELRLISYNTTTENPFFGERLDENSRIEEIIFGIKCPQTTKDTICNLIEKYNYQIMLSEMVQDEHNVYFLRKQKYEKNNIAV